MVSIYSPLGARSNALLIFFHARFVKEISTKYCRKSGIALKPYVKPIALHNFACGAFMFRDIGRPTDDFLNALTQC